MTECPFCCGAPDIRWARCTRCEGERGVVSDPIEQLRSAQPMARGERLATWIESGDRPPTHKTWNKMRYLSYSLSIGFEGSTSRKEAADRMRLHAAPLALARERRRRERAEMKIVILGAAFRELQSINTRTHALLDEVRAEVARLQPPTREEVERAVKNILDARERAFRHTGSGDAYQAAITAAVEAEEALVKLATRSKP